jgi:replicative DNA helicase
MRRDEFIGASEVKALSAAATHECDHCRILDGELSLRRIRLAARRMKAKAGLDCVIFDYGELIDAPGKDEFEQQKNLARGAKALAIELGCSVILVSQLRKPVSGEEAHTPAAIWLRGEGEAREHRDLCGSQVCKRPVSR